MAFLWFRPLWIVFFWHAPFTVSTLTSVDCQFSDIYVFNLVGKSYYFYGNKREVVTNFVHYFRKLFKKKPDSIVQLKSEITTDF